MDPPTAREPVFEVFDAADGERAIRQRADPVDAGQAIAERLAGIETELGALRALLETVFRLVVSAAAISPKMRRGLETAMLAGGLDPTRWLP